MAEQVSRAVFLSYARDDEAAARRIADALRASGIEVWFDQSELRGGDAWDLRIRQQIKECALFLPIISANTQARNEGYFRLEWRLADRRTELMGKSRAFVVPICIDATRDADADVPESFLAAQWTRLPDGDTNTAFCDRVRILLAPPTRADRSLTALSVRTPATTAHRKAAWVPWAATPVTLLLIVATWLAWPRRSPPPPPLLVKALTSHRGMERYPALSPDGRYVAFSWNGEKQDNEDIYVQLVGTAAYQRLTTDPIPDRAPVWSPDSTQLAFVRGHRKRGALYVTPYPVGQERKLTDFEPPSRVFDYGTAAVSWTPDGKWLAVPRRSDESCEIALVGVEVDEQRTLVVTAPQSDPYWPVFSPDGKFLAYSVRTLERDSDVHVLELDQRYMPKGQPRSLTHQGAWIEGLAWTPDGHSLIYAAAADFLAPFRLWRIPLAGTREPERLDVVGEHVWHPSLSRTGNRLAFARYDADYDIWKFERDRDSDLFSSSPQQFSPSTRWEIEPEFSPDGKSVAFGSDRSGSGSELWVTDADGTNPRPLTRGWGGIVSRPRWSPDGRWLAFHAHKHFEGWGTFVVGRGGGQPRRLATGRPPSPGINEKAPSWSHNGQSIYLQSDCTGRPEIYRVPLRDGESVQITQEGGSAPLASRDGKSLYYIDRSGRLVERTLADDTERIVHENVRFCSWTVVDDGIYILRPIDDDRNYQKGFEVVLRKLGAKSDQVLCQSSAALRSGSHGLTVSPDHKTILLIATATNGADLALVENLR